ncbi:NOP protein chaperone 1 [Chanos chanos]|uniref:NOP protein chaperone 1 n=1 Tax=Chanos chanos TaxID=29144 RepID=A0A6J2UW67_CHACN|nr:uncharacterized protein C12orf45 homolog [Chanos chanos]
MAEEPGKVKKNSQDLLTCGNGVGFHEKLVLKSQVANGASSLQTTKLPRSNVLDRLQRFLPQIAQANESLRQQMESAPAGHFDIECVEETGKVIEMDVALVEMEDSGSDTEEVEDSSEEEDDEITVETLKLPGNKKRKANIQVVKSEGV